MSKFGHITPRAAGRLSGMRVPARWFGTPSARRVVEDVLAPRTVCACLREHFATQDRYRPLYEDEVYKKMFPDKWWPPDVRPKEKKCS